MGFQLTAQGIKEYNSKWRDEERRMKISICNELFQGWPIEKVFRYAAGLGYDGVEIAPYTLADSVTEISQARRKAIRRAAEETGVEIVGLHWLLARPEGLYINHPDEIIRVRTQEYIEALIHFCADIGGKLLIHGSPHQRTVHEGWDSQEAWYSAKETFEVCLKTAQKRNVIYCIEPLAHGVTNFINTVEDSLRLVKEIRHPNFKIAFNCRSAAAEEKSVAAPLIRALESRYLYHIHLTDPNGNGPGFGELRFSPLLKILAEAGYKHHVSVEVFQFDPDPETVASRSIGYLKGIIEALK